MALFENSGKKTAAARGLPPKDGARAAHLSNGLAVVGLAVAGVAATGLAAGMATPVTGFTMFLMLLGGLSLVTIHVAQNAIGALRDDTDAAYLFSAARRNWDAALSLFSGPRVAWEQGLFSSARDAHCGYGLPSVAKDENAGGPDPAAVIGRGKDDASFAERMRVGLPVVGLAVAGVAATELATGVAAPVTGFTMLLMLLGGLSLVTIHVAQNAIGAVRDETDAAYLFSAACRNWNAALSLSSGPCVASEQRHFSDARNAHCGYGLPSVAKDDNAGGPDPAAVIGRGKNDASFAERMRVGLPVVGLAIAGVAATELATGVAAPVTGFTMFLMLLGGLSLVTIHVLRA